MQSRVIFLATCAHFSGEIDDAVFGTRRLAISMTPTMREFFVKRASVS